MHSSDHRTVALLLAAGTGSRAGGDSPKQFRLVGGKPVLLHALDALLAHPAIESVILVVGAGQETEVRALIGPRHVAAIVAGADTRRGSVRAGLDHVSASGGAGTILIHDAARPFLPAEVIDRLLAALAESHGAIPVLPVADTLIRNENGRSGVVVDRDGIVRVQTPQAFRFADILTAHRGWDPDRDATDDAQMLTANGFDVALVAGDERLEKLTYPKDFDRAEARLRAVRTTRVGMGYDVHRLADGEELWLGGVRIAHDRGLAGHSDADVALHAIVDALLGALAEGDIGTHFPPSDPQWRGAPSSRFLEYAGSRVAARGGTVEHIDLTIICEAPKIGPYRDAICGRISEILDLAADRISVKATTTERLGFTGREEGIAAQAVATLSLPALF